MNTNTTVHQLAGIIGGTGPEATNYFTWLLTKYRGHVNKDQDHIPFLVFNNTQIPDRSQYLLYGGESPVPELIRTGIILKGAGATFLIIPCNTAHAFVQEIEEGVGLPVMNMIEETVKHISTTYGKRTKVGLLATSGTIRNGVYHQAFSALAPHVELLTPDEETQKKIMKACYDIKKFSSDKNNYTLLNNAAYALCQQGAEVILLGCTEIPLALTQEACSFTRVDPMEVLAKEVITATYTPEYNFTRRKANKSYHPTQKVN